MFRENICVKFPLLGSFVSIESDRSVKVLKNYFSLWMAPYNESIPISQRIPLLLIEQTCGQIGKSFGIAFLWISDLKYLLIALFYSNKVDCLHLISICKEVSNLSRNTLVSSERVTHNRGLSDVVFSTIYLFSAYSETHRFFRESVQFGAIL